MALFSNFVAFKEQKLLIRAHSELNKAITNEKRACKRIETLITSCSYAKIGFRILATIFTKTA